MTLQPFAVVVLSFFGVAMLRAGANEFFGPLHASVVFWSVLGAVMGLRKWAAITT